MGPGVSKLVFIVVLAVTSAYGKLLLLLLGFYVLPTAKVIRRRGLGSVRKTGEAGVNLRTQRIQVVSTICLENLNDPVGPSGNILLF